MFESLKKAALHCASLPLGISMRVQLTPMGVQIDGQVGGRGVSTLIAWAAVENAEFDVIHAEQAELTRTLVNMRRGML